MNAVVGNDVIGTPGQHLTADELAHLVCLSDGSTPSQITEATGADRARQQQLESSIRAKLGAKSKPHMISRAFVLQVLAPRALCLLLSALSIGAMPDSQAHRVPRPGRSPVASMRASRSQRASASGGELPLATLTGLEVRIA